MGGVTEHKCHFPEVEIEDNDGPLKKGMKVLIPCEVCGETPLDNLDFMEYRQNELQKALLQVEPFRPLYHWSPRARRGQIIRYGLRPMMRPTTSGGDHLRVPYSCFADTPSWAWTLSGGMRYTPTGEWDLWMTYLPHITEPQVLATPERPSGLYEVRTEHRLYKRHLWWVGSRVKEG